MRSSTIGWSAALGRVQAACYGQPPRQTLPFRLRRRGSRACPARHGARPTPRLAGPSRPTLGPSALAGRRLAAATAGLRKASELFKHSCTNDSCNTPCTLYRRDINVYTIMLYVYSTFYRSNLLRATFTRVKSLGRNPCGTHTVRGVQRNQVLAAKHAYMGTQKK